MEKRSVFIILCVVMAIGVSLGGYFWWRKNSETAPPAPHTEEKAVTSSSTKSFHVSEIIPAVVKVKCYVTGKDSTAQEGSGFSTVDSEGETVVFTNAHVVRGEKDNILDYCLIYFPKKDGSSTFDTPYLATVVNSFDTITVTVGEEKVFGVDFSILKITDFLNSATSSSSSSTPSSTSSSTPSFTVFSGKLPDARAIIAKTCVSPVEITIGQKIFILGYPSIGGDNITVTEGIVSGFDESLNRFVKTSAKISFGNSGGIAVAQDDGCLIGIPTQITIGSAESLGEILSFPFLKSFFRALPRL